MRNRLFCLILCTPALLTGCGGGEYATAPVKGRVTAGGQPVKAGMIMFTPIMDEKSERGVNSGRPAMAELDENGNFVLSTYGDRDGAVIGKHRVSFEPAPGADDAEEDRPPAYLIPEEKAEVEVVDGQNEINIEVVSNPEAAKWRAPKARDD
jgi:hypothetical protein